MAWGWGHLRTTLKNNRAMLRKESMFKRKDQFLNTSEKNLKGVEGTVIEKPVSNYELNQIKNKTVQEEKNDIKRGLLISIIVTSIIFAVILTVGNTIYQEQSAKAQKRNIPIIIDRTKEYNEKYNFFIESGKEWLGKGNWKNAVFQFKNARKVFPKKLEANYLITLTYLVKCEKTGKNCDKSKELLDNLIQKFPNNSKIKSLQQDFTY